MRVTYKKSIEYRALQLIQQAPYRVLLRKDFAHLGSYRQITRALNALIKKRKIVKIGFGVYAKAYPSKYIDQPLIEAGFDVVAREALTRLGAKWKPGSAEQAYNAGESQQVPVQNIVQLKTRFRRNIAYGKRKLYFEGKVNAK